MYAARQHTILYSVCYPSRNLSPIGFHPSPTPPTRRGRAAHRGDLGTLVAAEKHRAATERDPELRGRGHTLTAQIVGDALFTSPSAVTNYVLFCENCGALGTWKPQVLASLCDGKPAKPSLRPQRSASDKGHTPQNG